MVASWIFLRLHQVKHQNLWIKVEEVREYLNDVLVLVNHCFEEVYFIFVHVHHLELGHANIVKEHLLEWFYLLLLLRVSLVDTAAWLGGSQGVSCLLHLVLEHQDHWINVVVVDLGSLFSLGWDLFLLLLNLGALRFRFLGNCNTLEECFDLFIDTVSRCHGGYWLLILVLHLRLSSWHNTDSLNEYKFFLQLFA